MRCCLRWHLPFGVDDNFLLRALTFPPAGVDMLLPLIHNNWSTRFFLGGGWVGVVLGSGVIPFTFSSTLAPTELSLASVLSVWCLLEALPHTVMSVPSSSHLLLVGVDLGVALTWDISGVRFQPTKSFFSNISWC